MKRIITPAVLLILPLQAIATTIPFINELHYDNDGADVGEGVEIAGPAGIVLDGWSLMFYNGNTGSVYATTALAGTITDQADGYGTVFFETGALQNGAPDGMALVDDGGDVLQFLSYEGVFQALDGAAAGSTSLGIGLSESSDTPVGWSLQLAGSGRTYSDFFWSSGVNSYDAINSEQSFAVVPLPATLPLLLCALAGLLTRRTMNMNDNG